MLGRAPCATDGGLLDGDLVARAALTIIGKEEVRIDSIRDVRRDEVFFAVLGFSARVVDAGASVAESVPRD